jgi:hypothetical protein
MGAPPRERVSSLTPTRGSEWRGRCGTAHRCIVGSKLFVHCGTTGAGCMWPPPRPCGGANEAERRVPDSYSNSSRVHSWRHSITDRYRRNGSEARHGACCRGVEPSELPALSKAHASSAVNGRPCACRASPPAKFDINRSRQRRTRPPIPPWLWREGFVNPSMDSSVLQRLGGNNATSAPT